MCDSVAIKEHGFFGPQLRDLCGWIFNISFRKEGENSRYKSDFFPAFDAPWLIVTVPTNCVLNPDPQGSA